MADGSTLSDQDVFAQMQKEDAQSRAQQNVAAVGAAGVKPQAAVQAVNQAPKINVPPSLGMTNPQEGQARVTQQNDSKNIDESPGVADWFGKSVAHAAASVGASDYVRNVVDKAADYWGGPGGTFLSGPSKDFGDAVNAFTQTLGQDFHRQLERMRGNRDPDAGDFFDFPVTAWHGAGYGAISVIAPLAAGARRAFGQLPLGDPVTGRPYDPEERQQAAADSVNTAFFGLTHRQKYGALTLRPEEPEGAAPGAKPVPPEPLQPGEPVQPMRPMGEGEALHTDESGDVKEFSTAKAAGIYGLQNPQPGNARWEVVTLNNGNYALKGIPGAPDVMTEHPPGANPEADALHVEEAKLAESQVADMQETVAAEPAPFKESQTLVRQLLEDQGLADQTAYIHAPSLASMHSSGALSTQELMNLVNPENDRDIETHFWNAVDGQADYAVPLSDYLAATNGKSWAGDVNAFTRFSENGVSTADAKELNPKPPEPEPFKGLSELSFTASKPGGSQPGGVFKDAEGTDWLVKGSSSKDTPEVTEDRARNEVLAGALLNAAIPGSAPELRLLDLGNKYGGGVGVASKMNYDLEPFDKDNPAHVKAVYQHFAVQALLANWDALGLDLDNTMIDRNGNAVAIDLGGALRYRAMGTPKGSAFGPNPGEWISMRQGGSKSQNIYNRMTEQDLLESAAYLKNLASTDAIYTLVQKYGPKDLEENNKLWQNLLSRLDALLAEAEKLGPIPDPPKLEVPSEEEWKVIEDLLKGPDGGPKEPTTYQEPFKPDPDLSDDENEALKLELPGLQVAAKQVANEVWLQGLFADGQALGMTGKELEQWSAKVKEAQKAVYERLLQAAKNRIKKFRSKEWERAYNNHLGDTQVEFYLRPGVKTWVQLTTPQEAGPAGGTDLVTGNHLVTKTPPIRPVTFYRATPYLDVNEMDNSWLDLFANPRAPQTPHPHWINTVKHSPHEGASFAENPAFAERWSKNFALHQEATSWRPEQRLITFVTHVYTPRHKIGDFRDPQDISKVMKWWQKKNPQQYGESDQAYATRTNRERKKYEAGSWGPWESTQMMKDLGWDATRMLENPGQAKDKPNLFVINPEAIHWKYDAGTGVPQEIRLRQADRKLVDPELLKKMPRGIWAKDGKDAETFAAEVGFANAQAMYEELADMNTRRGKVPFKTWLERQIKAEAAMRAQDELGWDLSKESLLEAAREMVDTPMLEDLLTDSLKYLKERFGLAFDKDMILYEAQEAFLQTPVKEALNIKLQERNLWRLMRQVEKGLVGTNQEALLEAFKARQDALKAHYKLRQALDFQRSYAAARRNWRGMAAKQTIKGLDQNFLNHIHASLAAMQLKVNRDPDELLESLNGLTTLQFITQHFVETAQQVAYADIPTYVDPNTLKLVGMPPERMNVRDFKNIQDMIVSLRKVGRGVDKIRTEKGAIRLLTIGTRVAANADKLGRNYTAAKLAALQAISVGGSGKIPLMPIEGLQVAKRKAGKGMTSAGGYFARPEVWLAYLDRNEWGPLQQFVMQVMQDGRYKEDALHKQIMNELNDFYMTQPDDWQGSMKNLTTIPLEFEGTFWLKTRGMAVTALLNLGTMENMNSLLKGFKWSYDDVIDGLQKELTKADVDFVQKIWDIHEKILWPEIVKTYRDPEVSGVRPRKKTNRTFTFRTKDGHDVELRGGYYGIHYSTWHLERMGKRNPAVGMAPSQMLGGEYESAAPANNYTKDVTGFVAPLDLSFQFIPFRMNQIMHDVSFRKPLIQAWKVLQQPDVVAAMQEVLGPRRPAIAKKWLQYVASEAVYNGSGMDDEANFIRGIRANYITVQVLYKVSTLILHPAIALMHVPAEVGFTKLPKALRDTALTSMLDFVRTPGQMSFWNQFINERSGEISNIEYGIDRDVRDTVIKLEQSKGPLAPIHRFGFGIFAFTKKVEARVTWLARYRQVMEDTTDKFGKYSGGDEEAAIFLANKAVRDTQGSGAITDLPPFLRGGHDAMGEAGKLLFTTFMGFRNVTFNRGWTMSMGTRRVLEGRGTKKDWNMVGQLMGFFIMPSLVWAGEQKFYRQEPDSIPALIGEGLAHNTLGSLPLGDLTTDLAASTLEGKGLEGERHSPQAQMLYSQIATIVEAAHLLDHDIPGPKEPLREFLDAISYWGVGIPDQFAISAQYALNVEQGDQSPTTIGEAAHNLLSGPPPKEKAKRGSGQHVSRQRK